MLFTETETAEHLRLSKSFLRQARLYGVRPGHIEPPPHLKLGRVIRYEASAIEAWIERHRVAPKRAPVDAA